GVRRRGLPGPVPPRGRGRRPTPAPDHRADLRGRRPPRAGRRRLLQPVHRPGVRRGRQPRPAARPAAPARPGERPHGRGARPAADIYALGVILFEMLTGRRPFEGENALTVMDGVLREPPPSPRRLRPDVPRDLEVICLKCLTKEPGRRYATAAELADDLARFQ